MGYVIIVIVIVILVGLLPFSIRNITKFRQERISKKASQLGVQLDFKENNK